MAERVGFENTKKRTFNKIQRNGWGTFRSVGDVLMRDSKQIPVATDLELFKGGQPACPGSGKADFNLHARFSLHCLLKHYGGPATTACEPHFRYLRCDHPERDCHFLLLPLACSDFRSLQLE